MDISLDAANALESAIDRKIGQAAAKRTRAYGEVSRIDADGTVYVMLDGAETDTPASANAAAVKEGERVGVTVDNGEMVIDGNFSAPATDDTAAKRAQSTADAAVRSADIAATAAAQAVESAGIAAEAAEEAQDSLMSVVQGATTVEKAVSVMQTALEAVIDYDPDEDEVTEYFWHDANGAHVLGDTSGYRNDINSSGMDIKQVSTEDSVASFGANGWQVGLDDESHMVGDYHSLQLIDKEGDAYFHVSDLRDSTGLYEQTETFIGNGTNVFFAVAFEVSSVVSVEINDVAVSSSDYSISLMFLVFRTPPARDAVIKITYKTDTPKAKAFTFGSRDANEVIGAYSFAIGDGTAASGSCSSAEGYGSVAQGPASHAQNNHTIASRPYQTALGMYNATYSGAAVIIGNGTANNARSNALMVDWDGNVLMAGEAKDFDWNNRYIAAIGTTESGSDLNDQPIGAQWWGNNFTNAPTTGYYRVIKFGAVQLAVGFAGNSDAPTMHVRSNVNSAWQPWMRCLAPSDIAHIGTVYSGDWTAASSSAVNVQLTQKLTLPAGTYAISMMLPIASGTGIVRLYDGSSEWNQTIFSVGNYSNKTVIMTFSAQTQIWIASISTGSVTYSNPDRGGITAVRLA